MHSQIILHEDDDRTLFMNSVLNQSPSIVAERIAENSSSQTDKSDLDSIFKELSQAADDKAIIKVIALLEKRLIELELTIWKDSPSEDDITQYHNTFKALEKLYELKTKDERYNFKIVIPVADRPQHLKQCLASLLTLCKSYEYGGFKNNKFEKISVLIADDSRENENIILHKKYCAELTRNGITTEYFGLAEQLALVKTSSDNNNLTRIISSADNINNFSHKGASIMRNITYLKLRKEKHKNNTLIYFIDSDQEFCVNSPETDDNYYAINYFHYLNDIFKNQDVDILTGKVVGDPPVSPSVMAGNFQLDIQNFLSSISRLTPNNTCQFHQTQSSKDDAAYHDMADLFGFSDQPHTHRYHCTLDKAHDNTDCFFDFSTKLEKFFYGEHPTRKTFFNYGNGFSTTDPARTVYTGNYVIKPSALSYFIPFATLKLRMAGPVLGRILKNMIDQKFVSANLPMLHKRTVESTGQSEFRAGVETKNKHVDLSNEFVRQFYGDVMLFSMEKITDAGFPDAPVNEEAIQTIIKQIYTTIKDIYTDKHDTILRLKTDIHLQLNDNNHWWNNSSEHSRDFTEALLNFDTFLNNIQSNFDENSDAYKQITSLSDVEKNLDNILKAILHYSDDCISWNNLH